MSDQHKRVRVCSEAAAPTRCSSSHLLKQVFVTLPIPLFIIISPFTVSGIFLLCFKVSASLPQSVSLIKQRLNRPSRLLPSGPTTANHLPPSNLLLYRSDQLHFLHHYIHKSPLLLLCLYSSAPMFLELQQLID